MEEVTKLMLFSFLQNVFIEKKFENQLQLMINSKPTSLVHNPLNHETLCNSDHLGLHVNLSSMFITLNIIDYVCM